MTEFNREVAGVLRETGSAPANIVNDAAAYDTCFFSLDEWSEVDCYLMEQDGWTQDGPVKGGWIRYRRPRCKQEVPNGD